MATVPKKKVSFKINDILEEEFPVEVGEKHSLETYVILYYSTVEGQDDPHLYQQYLNETTTDFEQHKARYQVIKSFAQDQVKEGIHTGYKLFAYVLTPFSMLSVSKMMRSDKDFQIKHKTYLNGPLKDNEFLAKKGKHYA
jgi:hypothetical protein